MERVNYRLAGGTVSSLFDTVGGIDTSMWTNGPTRRRVLWGVAGASVVPLVAYSGTTQAEPLAVSIRETNDPVAAGDRLEVIAEVDVDGDESLESNAILVVGHDPTVVGVEPVEVDAGATETVTLAFETADVDNDQEFPAWVVVEDAVDRTDVFVYADALPVGVTILETNDPVTAGSTLEVTAELENESDGETTREAVLIVGHDPERVDSTDVTVGPGETETVTLAFETATVEHTQEFPVRVESEDDADERSVQVVGTADDPVEPDVRFPSCTRAEVSGTFGDGDSVAASTGFYDEANGEALYGNTIIEDWIEIGEHVDAPFSGTIVFEIGDDRTVSETDDGARVEVPDYGDLGTVISGITLPEDYMTATITHGNPQASSCLGEIADDVDDGATVAVSITGTNAPVDAGDPLEVTARLENAGDGSVTQDVVLIVGHDPQQVDSATVDLEAGATRTVTLGYDTYPAERTTEFPARVESEDDADEVTVRVIGTDETDG